MTGTPRNRLDRIEAILKSTDEHQARNARGIDTLVSVCSSNEVACRDLRETATENAAACRELRISITENQDRFVVLREEAKANRAETRRLFNDAITQVETDRAQARERAERDQAESRAGAERDRAESRANFEKLQREAAEDRRRADEHHTAQMEVIQTLLLELTKTNRNVTDLPDRVDLVEQVN